MNSWYIRDFANKRITLAILKVQILMDIGSASSDKLLIDIGANQSIILPGLHYGQNSG